MQWRLIAPVLLAALAFWAGWEWRDRSADLGVARVERDTARAEVGAHAAARAVERTNADTLSAIGETHEQARAAAEAVPDAVVADLRAGVLQLRNDLATCHTARLSEAVAGSVERDAPAELRAEVAGALVRVGRDADDQLAACQAVIRADRGVQP